jgi:hypothetical protein
MKSLQSYLEVEKSMSASIERSFFVSKLQLKVVA